MTSSFTLRNGLTPNFAMIKKTVIAAASLLFIGSPVKAQSPVQYFLDDAPAATEIAPDIVIARVRILQAPFYIGGRHGEFREEPVLGTNAEIIDVVQGDATKGAHLFVYFGDRDKRISSSQALHICVLSLISLPIQDGREKRF